MYSIEFVNAYLLLNRNQSNTTGADRDRLNYILDQTNSTPGKRKFLIDLLIYVFSFLSGYISRDEGQQVLDHLNRFYT